MALGTLFTVDQLCRGIKPNNLEIEFLTMIVANHGKIQL